MSGQCPWITYSRGFYLEFSDGKGLFSGKFSGLLSIEFTQIIHLVSISYFTNSSCKIYFIIYIININNYFGIIPRELLMKRMMRLGPPPPAHGTHHHSLAPLYRPQIHFENTNLIRREMGSVDSIDWTAFLTNRSGPERMDRIDQMDRVEPADRMDRFADVQKWLNRQKFVQKWNTIIVCRILKL